MKRTNTASHCLSHNNARVFDENHQLAIGSILFWHDYTIEDPSLAEPQRKKKNKKKKHADQKSHLTKFGIFSHVAIIVGFVGNIPRVAHAARSPDGSISFVMESGLPTYDGNPDKEVPNSFLVFSPKTNEAKRITTRMVDLAKKLTDRSRYQIEYGVNRSLNMSEAVGRLHAEVNHTQRKKGFDQRLQYIYNQRRQDTAASFTNPNLVARQGLTLSRYQHGALVPLKYLLMLNSRTYPEQVADHHFTSQGWHCVQFIVLLFQMAMLENNVNIRTFIKNSALNDVAYLSRKYKSSEDPQKKHLNQVLKEDYKPRQGYPCFIESLEGAMDAMAYDGKHLDPGTFLHILHQWDDGSGGDGGGEKMFNVDYFYVTKRPDHTADEIINNIDILINDLGRLSLQLNAPIDTETVYNLTELSRLITRPEVHRLPNSYHVSADNTAPYGLQGTACSITYLYKFIELAIKSILAKQLKSIARPKKKARTQNSGLFGGKRGFPASSTPSVSRPR